MCGLMALSACTMSSGPQLGPDGRPLPRVYKLRPADLAKVQANMQEGINTLRAARGAVPLQPNQQLFMAATAHAAEEHIAAAGGVFGVHHRLAFGKPARNLHVRTV